jgi:DNA-binding transcriptional ArsR family regulator
MPTIMITHDVTDTDRWLSSPKREEILPSLGASNIRTFVNPQDRTKVGLVMDIEDLDALFAALESPSEELTEAMTYDTVRPETMVVLIGS